MRVCGSDYREEREAEISELVCHPERSGVREAEPTDGAGAGPGSNGGGQKKDEGVIDAEYVDVEDKK